MRKSAYASAALGPIVPIWSEHAHIPALKHHLAAIAVVFESVESSSCPLEAHRPR